MESSGYFQINVMNKQLDSVNIVVHKLEEKEKIYQSALSNLEKEMLTRQQTLELHKRKAIENAQSAADLKLHLGGSKWQVLSLAYLIEVRIVHMYICISHFIFRKISCPDEGSSTNRVRENERFRSRSV